MSEDKLGLNERRHQTEPHMSVAPRPAPPRVKVSHSAEVSAEGYSITMEALRSLCANNTIPGDAEVRFTQDDSYLSGGRLTVRVTWTR